MKAQVCKTLEALHAGDEIGRLETLYRVDAMGLPVYCAPNTFFLRRSRDEEVHVLVVRHGTDERVLCDPTVFTGMSTASIRNFFVSPDGTYVLCEISKHNNDTVSFEIFSIDGAHVDSIPAAVFPRKPCWRSDEKGFWYARCGKEDAANPKMHRQLFYHALDDSLETDTYIFGKELHEQDTVIPFVSENGHLVVQVNKDTGKKRTQDIYVQSEQGDFVKIIDGVTLGHTQWYARVHKNALFLYTNYKAPLWCVRAIEINDSLVHLGDVAAASSVVIPEKHDVLEQYAVSDDMLIAEYVHHMSAVVEHYTRDGTYVRTLDIPKHTTVAGFGSTEKGVCIALTSFGVRLDIYVYDGEGSLKLFHTCGNTHDLKLIETLVWCKSKDGTRIPMFIVHKKDIELDHMRPTLIYGYGGFNYSARPAFRPYALALIEEGGVFVLPALRGGKEYGERWHEAGMRENRKHVLDDINAVVKHLIEARYTSNSHVGIIGWSNGGLLAATVLTQSPALMGAAIVGAPVTDLLSFHTNNDGGARWRSDFGDPETEDAVFLERHSPQQAIEEGVAYPATMVLISTHDDRVVPEQGRKFAQSLAKANGADTPIILKEEKGVGHGGSPQRSALIATEVDVVEFLLVHLSK